MGFNGRLVFARFTEKKPKPRQASFLHKATVFLDSNCKLPWRSFASSCLTLFAVDSECSFRGTVFFYRKPARVLYLSNKRVVLSPIFFSDDPHVLDLFVNLLTNWALVNKAELVVLEVQPDLKLQRELVKRGFSMFMMEKKGEREKRVFIAETSNLPFTSPISMMHPLNFFLCSIGNTIKIDIRPAYAFPSSLRVGNILAYQNNLFLLLDVRHYPSFEVAVQQEKLKASCKATSVSFLRRCFGTDDEVFGVLALELLFLAKKYTSKASLNTV